MTKRSVYVERCCDPEKCIVRKMVGYIHHAQKAEIHDLVWSR
jgi:hypothetical protein